jgi:hypothetical protein
MASNTATAIGAVVEELEFGRSRRDILRYSAFCRRLADDTSTMSGGPTAYFRFQASKTAGDLRPLDVPNIPVPSQHSGSGNRGWAFATWLQISPPAFGEDRTSSILIARFTSIQAQTDTEIFLVPSDQVPQVYRVVIRLQHGSGSAAFRSGRKVPSVEGSITLSSLRWHHIAVSQTQPYIKLIKPPRLTFYLDGQWAFDAVSVTLSLSVTVLRVSTTVWVHASCRIFQRPRCRSYVRLSALIFLVLWLTLSCTLSAFRSRMSPRFMRVAQTCHRFTMRSPLPSPVASLQKCRWVGIMWRGTALLQQWSA